MNVKKQNNLFFNIILIIFSLKKENSFEIENQSPS